MFSKIKTVFSFFFGTAILVTIFFPLFSPAESKPEKQYPRVQRARRDSDSSLRQLFDSRRLTYPADRIYIRVFKKERSLELWVLAENNTYVFLNSYPFCSTSGVMGPKRRRGDFQIPEGIYFITHFNPWSKFFLSLGINYPNRSDRIRGDKKNPGGDIFIHGSCVTIGCIPITDEKIKELYWMSVQARRRRQECIPVHIFPARMEENNLRKLYQIAANPIFWQRLKSSIGNNHPHTSAQLIAFWENLKGIYDYFEKTHRIPRIGIDRLGEYVIKQ